jgi:hypothetical protein
VAMLTMLAVVMTHHMTAYALVAVLVLLSLAATFGLGRPREAAWGLAIFAAAAIVLWLLEIAPLTGDYLASIFSRAFEGVSSTVSGASAPRRLFTSSGGNQAPLWDRALGLGSVIAIAVVLPFGLWRVWRRRSRFALLVVLGAASAAYLAILPLRLVPTAWETANRASDFLYIGIGLTVALAGLQYGRAHGAGRIRRTAVCAFVGLTTVGGVVSGWPPDVRLSQPLRATVGGHEIVPQGVTAARWSLSHLGPDHRFVADESNGRLLLADGLQLPLVGRNGAARTILEPPKLVSSVVNTIRSAGVSYALIDRRSIADDGLAGVFFAPRGEPREGAEGTIGAGRIGKLDVSGTDRIYDSGDVVIYDVRRIGP